MAGKARGQATFCAGDARRTAVRVSILGILPTAAIPHRRQTLSIGRFSSGSGILLNREYGRGRRVAGRHFAPETPAAPPRVSPSRNGRIGPGSTGGGVSRLHLPSFACLAAYRADARDMEGGAPLCDLTSVCYTLQKQRLAARAGMEMSPQAAFRGRQHSCRLCGHAAKTLDGG